LSDLAGGDQPEPIAINRGAGPGTFPGPAFAWV